MLFSVWFYSFIGTWSCQCFLVVLSYKHSLSQGYHKDVSLSELRSSFFDFIEISYVRKYWDFVLTFLTEYLIVVRQRKRIVFGWEDQIGYTADVKKKTWKNEYPVTSKTELLIEMNCIPVYYQVISLFISFFIIIITLLEITGAAVLHVQQC